MRQQFRPTPVIGFLWCPGYLARRPLYKVMLRYRQSMTGRLLDIGCGRMPYREMFSTEQYYGIDVPVSGHHGSQSKPHVYFDGVNIPVLDSSIDSILVTQVLEHVFDVKSIVSDVFRALKPGGVVLITIPFVFPEHEVPYDFWRYTSFGLPRLMSEIGFDVQSVEKTGGYIEAQFMLWTEYILQLLVRRRGSLWALVVTAVFLAPLGIIGLACAWLLPKDSRLYIDLVIFAKRPLASARG